MCLSLTHLSFLLPRPCQATWDPKYKKTLTPTPTPVYRPFFPACLSATICLKRLPIHAHPHPHSRPIPSFAVPAHQVCWRARARCCGEAPGGNLPGKLRRPRKEAGAGRAGYGAGRVSVPGLRERALEAGSARRRGALSALDPSGLPSPTRARPEPAPDCAPAGPALQSARFGDASSPAAALGIFVYIRARGQTWLWRACHRLAISFTRACRSPGSSGDRRALAFLSASVPSSS